MIVDHFFRSLRPILAQRFGTWGCIYISTFFALHIYLTRKGWDVVGLDSRSSFVFLSFHRAAFFSPSRCLGWG